MCSSVVFSDANNCSGVSSYFCNQLNFHLQAKPNYANDFEKIKGSIKVTINETDHDFLDVVLENRPTSQCHWMTFGHVVTFDQWKFQLKNDSHSATGKVLFHRNGDFVIWLLLQPCKQMAQKMCACGFLATDGDKQDSERSQIEINYCTAEFKMARNKIGAASHLFLARNNTMGYVSDVFLEVFKPIF